MNIKKWAPYILACSMAIAVGSCQNPLENFELIVSDNVIRDRTTLEILDTDGEAITDANVKLLSGDIADIYNSAGKKDFRLIGNTVTFGLDPKRTPTTAAPVSFQVELSAEGYYTQTVSVNITNNNNGVYQIRMVKPTSLPEGASIMVESATLASDGTLPAAVSLSIPQSATELTIPQGVRFLDASGTVITGSVLSLSVLSYDPTEDSALALFPGSSLQATGVVGQGGQTSNGVFNPAATANITMTVDGTTVRGFSTPIAVKIGIDPDFTPRAGSVINVGATLPTYSYTPSEGFWKYETAATIGGGAQQGYHVAFTTNHLSTYSSGEYTESCGTMAQVSFDADWIEDGFTYPVKVQAFHFGNLVSERLFSISEDSKLISLDYLPANNVQIVVRSTVDDSIIAEGPLAACGSVTNFALADPDPDPEPKVTLQLYVRCPDKTEPITLLPSFMLYYRVSGQSSYELLGEVKNGFLQTTLLKSDGTKYDFRAIYNARIKDVNSKTVEEDNTATVGDNPSAGEIRGEKAGATNLAILTEECNKFYNN